MGLFVSEDTMKKAIAKECDCKSCLVCEVRVMMETSVGNLEVMHFVIDDTDSK